jgi:putative Holliday junction resolvase
VFGLPIDPSGNETPRSQEVRDAAAKLVARQPLPVRLVDERFTTSAALRSIKAQGGSTRGRKEDVDALAAAILLEGVLRAAAQGVTIGEFVAPAGSAATTAPEGAAHAADEDTERT